MVDSTVQTNKKNALAFGTLQVPRDGDFVLIGHVYSIAGYSPKEAAGERIGNFFVWIDGFRLSLNSLLLVSGRRDSVITRMSQEYFSRRKGARPGCFVSIETNCFV